MRQRSMSLPDPPLTDPWRIDRRALLAGGLMAPGAALAARLAPPDDQVNAASIRWPVGPARELHGYMAIPARARGRQPALIVFGGRDTTDLFARQLVRSAAQAGFVACTPNSAAILDDRIGDDLGATSTWLANGRYGTGRVAGVGIGSGIDPIVALVARGRLAAAATFGDAPRTPGGLPLLRVFPSGDGWATMREPGAAAMPDLAWAAAWAEAMTFLREHLT